MFKEARQENGTILKPPDGETTARIQPLEGARSERSVHVLVVGEKDYHKMVVDALAAAEVSLIDHVATEAELFDKLQREEFDCLITDQTACGHNSLELRELIEQRIPNHPAMIMLTNVNNRNVILKAFRSGFSDFVSTDHRFNGELVQAVHRSVERNRKTQILIDEIEHLSMLAHYDRLTGAPNRYFLEERLASLIASAERHKDTFAVLLIGINKFEAICDIHGHAVGDQILKTFAQKLMSASRASDSFGRFGGDEFLYLIDRDVSYPAVAQACTRLGTALSFSVGLDSVSVALSASIGGAMYPSDGMSAAALLDAARQAMFAAKAMGGGYHLLREGQPVAASTNQTAAAVADPGTRDSGATAATAAADVANLGGRVGNRRREHRDRVLFRGRIILGDGFSTIECAIRDLSPHGARVTVQDHAVVPRTFSLAIFDTGRTYDAIRRWQRGQSIGLEFSVGDDGRWTSAQQPASDGSVPET